MMTQALAVAAPSLSDIAADINENHELAVMYAGQAFDHAVKAGLLLIEAKAQVPHGQWLAWLKANVRVSARQAQNYMKLASCPDEKRNAVADLSMRKAIHALALQAADKPRKTVTSKDPNKPLNGMTVFEWVEAGMPPAPEHI